MTATAAERQAKYRAANRAKLTAYQREWARRNPDKVAGYQRVAVRPDTRPAIRAEIAVRRDALGCSGEGPHGGVLHWHHLDPETKLFPIARAAGYGKARREAEIAKCTVLCNACHDREHARCGSVLTHAEIVQ